MAHGSEATPATTSSGSAGPASRSCAASAAMRRHAAVSVDAILFSRSRANGTRPRQTRSPRTRSCVLNFLWQAGALRDRPKAPPTRGSLAPPPTSTGTACGDVIGSARLVKGCSTRNGQQGVRCTFALPPSVCRLFTQPLVDAACVYVGCAAAERAPLTGRGPMANEQNCAHSGMFRVGTQNAGRKHKATT